MTEAQIQSIAKCGITVVVKAPIKCDLDRTIDRSASYVANGKYGKKGVQTICARAMDIVDGTKRSIGDLYLIGRLT